MRGQTKKSESKNNREEVEYKIGNITRAKEFTKDNGLSSISFDIVINGITIYGMWYHEYTTKEGNDGEMIVFPQRKGNDNKYYNNVFFPISKEMKNAIIELLKGML